MKLLKNRFLKSLSVIVLSLSLVFVGILGIYDYIIPDRVSFFEDKDLPVFMYAEAWTENGACDNINTAEYRLLGVLPLKKVDLDAHKDIKLIPGGMAFGVKFFTEGLIIAGFSDVATQSGDCNPAKTSGLKINDVITHINGKAVTGTQDLGAALEASCGESITLTYLRGDKSSELEVTPVCSSSDGKFKIGVIIKDSGAGIGTVSFIDPESGFFAGLGHGICNSENGALIPMKRGIVLDVTISGIEKGESGAPGEIKGFFNQSKLGSMIKNTECGVYGVFTKPPVNPLSEALPIGLKGKLKEGEAKIFCTLEDGKMKAYSVSISDINRNADGGKCFTVKVTDPALIEKTGGIIQGMSGSPIIQNGKLVGAVTHVLVNDPTRGYGIFIENMLNQIDVLTS